MDGEVVDALFGLFDEGVPEEFPGEVFDTPVHFLKGLVDGDGADGDGAVADDPFAGGVDVLPGGKIHDGIGTPFGGPAHFLDFFIDGGGDGRVADVRVDLHEEVAANDHRFAFRVIDVGGDDGAAGGDFLADELGGDVFRYLSAVSLAGMLVIEDIARTVDGVFRSMIGFLASEILPDGNEFHLGGDDALTGVPKLGDGVVLGAEWFPHEAGVFLEAIGTRLVLVVAFGVFLAEVAVVGGGDGSAFVFFDIAAIEDPLAAEGGKAFFDIAVKGGVSPGAAGVVDAHGVVLLHAAVGMMRLREFDFAHGHTEIGVRLSFDVEPVAFWKERLFATDDGVVFRGSNHG